jgi:DNA polymerase-3 subunit delta'
VSDAVSIERHVNPWHVWGQDHAVSELVTSFPDAIRHAYVISGPAMAGKSTLATAFVQALMCPQSLQSGVPCRNCLTCRLVERGLHQDMSRFDLEWQHDQTSSDKRTQALNIETVRAITRSVFLRPVESRWRAVIVDDVETMQETAQEAFLKTLEEPPPYTVLLLLTDDLGSLLPTILSRAVSIRVAPTSFAEVAAALVERGVDESIAEATALVSEGIVGWAIRTIDDPAERERRSKDYAGTASWLSGDAHQRMIHAMSLADGFSGDKDGVFRRLTLAMIGWRTILRHNVGLEPDSASIPGLAYAASIADTSRAIDSIRQCMFDLESNVRPRLAMQSMLQAWPTFGRE